MGLFVFFSACKKETAEVSAPPPEILTVKQQERIEVLKDVSSILLEVYKDPIALYEVNAAIYSEFYEDETVLLKDLLYPEWSRLYQTEKFKARKPRTGVFRSKFIDQFNKADYPHLRTALGKSVNQFELNGLSSPSPNIPDTAMEIFTNSAGVNIYFPYSENFGSNFTPAWFDNINHPEWGPLATIVTADRNADTGPGQQPFRVFTNGIGQIQYRTVTVSDSYAETKMTHIVGIGAEPSQPLPMEPDPPTTGPFVNRVYTGIASLRFNYDRFISRDGNGGGSEIKIGRISGYLQIQNQQVVNFAGDAKSFPFKRGDVKGGKWRTLNQTWDPDWVEGNLEQTYVVWEEDTEGTRTLTGSLTTTIRIGPAGTPANPGSTIGGSIGYSVTVKTQDELITQTPITRYSYFRLALANQGWGYDLCNKKGQCVQDNFYLPSGQFWPMYDGASNWRYTWPYRTY